MNFDEILDAAVKASGATSDSDLARKLGVSRQAVSTWRTGGKLPDAVKCATIAGLTGIPLAKVLGVVGEARAISREEKAVWRKLAATAALLAVVVFPTLHTSAQAATGWEGSYVAIHYAKYKGYDAGAGNAPESPECPSVSFPAHVSRPH